MRIERLILVSVLLPLAALAQSDGSIEGTVLDPAGAVVPQARVELTGVAVSSPDSAVTDGTGHFRFDRVAAGHYTLSVSRSGFATSVRTVDLASSGVQTIEIRLELGAASGTMTVTASAATAEALDVPIESGSRLGLTPRETPALINVVSLDQAQAQGLRTTVEALNSVPGVSSGTPVGAPGAIAIRGFSGIAISTLFDGTRTSDSTMVTRQYDTWSFDSVEVLKGPASVLYGEGALAGAVNFVTRHPDFTKQHGEALLTLGTLGSGRAAADATGPLGKRAAYRADVSWDRKPGYIDRNHFQNFAGTGALDLRPSSSVSMVFSVDHFRDSNNLSYAGTPLVPGSIAHDPSDVVTSTQGLVLDGALRSANYTVTDSLMDSHETWVRGKLDWRLGSGWRLTNQFDFYTALRRWKELEVYNYDAPSGLITRSAVALTHDQQFYGDRLTLSSDRELGGLRNRFAVGVEANRNDFFNPRRFGNADPVDPYQPVPGLFPADNPTNFPGAGNRVNFTSTQDLLSGFAEDALKLASRLTVVGGVRYDQLKVDRVVNDLNTVSTSTFDRLFKPVNWRGGLVLDVLPRTQLFGQYTSAAAPVATMFLISQANAAFNLTTGRSAEGGVKTTLAGGRLEAMASVFKITQDNILTRDPNHANITIQGGTQASTGVDFSVSADPLRRLRVQVNGAFLDARFEKLIEAGGISRAGNVPPNVPERTSGLWATYRLAGAPVTISGGLHYHGRFFTDNANSIRVAGFTLLDAQVSWRVGPGEIVVRGRNLTDRLYADWTGASSSQVMLGAPRTADVSYHVRF